MSDELEKLKSDNEKLRADLEKQADAMLFCEGCSAPLYHDDDFVMGDDCSGCWQMMTEGSGINDRPCYAYRVGKPDANDRVKVES